jgi:hypothetical protein
VFVNIDAAPKQTGIAQLACKIIKFIRLQACISQEKSFLLHVRNITLCLLNELILIHGRFV